MPEEKQVTMYNLINWNTLYRGYNGLIATIVLLQYLNKPEAAAMEYLPDAALHALEAIAPNSLNNLALGSNIARGIQAGLAFFSGNSTIPSGANLVDVFNHGVITGHRLAQ